MPGHNGGANWGSSAINPQRGLFFIVSKELPVFTRLYAPGTAPGRRGGGGGGRGGAPAAPPEAAAPARGPAPPTVIPGAPAGFVAYSSPVDFFNNYANGLSAIGPPWSQLTAYDLNTGKILWQVPDGEMPGSHLEGKESKRRTFPTAGARCSASH